MVKNLLDNAEDAREADSIPGLGRFPGGGNDDLLQYSCMDNFTGRGGLAGTLHGATKTQTGLSD